MKLSKINEARYHPNSRYDDEDGFEFEEIITRQNYFQEGWKRLILNLPTVYKATNNLGTIIPGFATTDLEEAKLYLGGGDWGGQYLAEIQITRPTNGQTKQDYILDGREGPIKFEAGVPVAMIRGTEVVILKPEEVKPFSQTR